MFPHQPIGNVRNDLLKLGAFTLVIAIGGYLLDSTLAEPPRRHVMNDPRSGIYATVISETLRMGPDPDEALRGRRVAWAMRFEDREAANNFKLPETKVVRFRDGERVKVLEKREHVVNDAGGWMNWSRIQSIDRADLPAAWVIDQWLTDK
jgi:hypothetical protein